MAKFSEEILKNHTDNARESENQGRYAFSYRPISELIEYARNPRKNDHAVDKIAAAIREFGFRVPVVAKDDGSVVDGHLRLKAAKKLGMAEVPVISAEGMSEQQIKAFRLSVNRMAEIADWDVDLLKLEIADLEEMGFDLELTGFGDDFLAGLLNDGTEGLTDPDDIPEPPVDPVTQPGDVWLMGKHRIVCGSSTVETDVGKCLNGVEPHLMVTDPPYGVEYDAGWRDRAIKDRWTNDNTAKGAVRHDDQADWSEAWALFPGDVAYVWCAPGPLQCVSHDSLARAGIPPKAQIIWAKNQFAIGRGDYHYQHEVCWYAVRKNRKGHYCGNRKQTSIWNIDKPQKSETGHSTQKPVECMRRPVVNNSSPGQAIYEPFSGSGTTIIACEMEGRSCHAIELNPAYVDVAIKRWQDFTGEAATLESTGKTFQEVNDESS